MALSYITSVINGALDNNLRVAGLFLDLIEAFETVDHQILLRKCEFYGLRIVLLDCLVITSKIGSNMFILMDFIQVKVLLNVVSPRALY